MNWRKKTITPILLVCLNPSVLWIHCLVFSSWYGSMRNISLQSALLVLIILWYKLLWKKLNISSRWGFISLPPRAQILLSRIFIDFKNSRWQCKQKIWRLKQTNKIKIKDRKYWILPLYMLYRTRANKPFALPFPLPKLFPFAPPPSPVHFNIKGLGAQIG